MLSILNAIIPVFAIIALGYTLKHKRFLETGFWPAAENLAFYFLLPAILFTNIAHADFKMITSALPMGGVVLSALFINALLVAIISKFGHLTLRNYTAITQGSVQTNAAYLGIPISLAVFGKEGLVLYSMLLGIVVPIANFAILGFLVYHDKDYDFHLLRFASRFAKHPLILACAGGLVISYCHIILPTALASTLTILSNAAIFVGLIIVGGALDIKATKGSRHYIALATTMKLIILPNVALGFASLFHFTAFEIKIALLYTILPTAAYSYLLAKKHNGNAPLMAGIIVTETISAAITMPLILMVITALLGN